MVDFELDDHIPTKQKKNNNENNLEHMDWIVISPINY